jgi:hypothetical protein
MPKLTETSIIIRQNQALNVMVARLQDHTLTLKDACEKEGISVESYHHWIRESPDAMDVLREYLLMAKRQQLFEIETAWGEALGEVIKDVLNPVTKAGERVTSMNFLKKELEDLEGMFHAAPGIEEDAQAFLKKGPKLVSVQSRMTSIEVTPKGDGVNIQIGPSTYRDVVDLPIQPAKEEDPQ